MRLSVENSEIRRKFGEFRAIEMLKEAGFDAFDYSFYDVEESVCHIDNYKEYAKEVRAHMDKVGIVCNQAHAPFRLSRFEAFDMTEPHYLEIVRSIEAASILGADCIIVHPVYIPVGETYNGITYEEYNRRFYKSLEPYCEKFGIKVAVENMFYYDEKRQCRRGMLHTMEEIRSMIESIDSPYFTACIDIGHLAITSSLEPECFIENMDSSIVTAMHLHDNNYTYDNHQLPYIFGINFENVMKAFKKSGYRGDLTFEICSFLNRFPDALSLDALKMSVAVGRYLISLFDAAE